MTPQEYCQNKAAQSGSSFYYSFLILPKDKRDAITALYAFCREVDDIVDSRGEDHIKHTKLAWWREEVGRLFKGTPQHPISRAIAQHLEHYNLSEEYFLEILDGMAMDMDVTRYASFRELSLYCYRVASVVGILSAEIFGYQDRQTLKYAHDLGTAFQLTNIIRDVYEDIQRDRLYLPQDEMQEFGVSIEDIRQQRQTPAFARLMQYQVDRANSYYEKAMNELPEIDRYNQRAGLIMAEIYRTLLREIVSGDKQVLTHRIALSPMRKLWIAWITRRREAKRFRHWTRQQANGG